MTQTIEVSARTVEDAIKKGIAELGISEADAQIEVLDEGDSGGLFGFGRKDAIVRISAIEETESSEEDFATDDAIDEIKEVVEMSIEEQEEIEQSAVKFIASIMQNLGIHGKMSSYFDEEGTLHLNIVGDNVGGAIGRRGETLDALQYLTILAVNKNREEYTRVSLDIGGYRERRIKNMAQNARRSADRVLRTGRRYTLKPMSPAERRQVHIALQDYEGVKTYSEGKEPERCVVIALDNEE
ncbi:MAG TPA: protein jag [Clostridiaceae bacterium]|jgi:spoIIIJ-associated protein|nr:protein jag [Clostridiaceae bacterium]